jgi:hypothetical protein
MLVSRLAFEIANVIVKRVVIDVMNVESFWNRAVDRLPDFLMQVANSPLDVVGGRPVVFSIR